MKLIKQENIFRNTTPIILDQQNFIRTSPNVRHQYSKHFRKSLGTIPFRKLSIDRANITQIVPRFSLIKTMRKQKISNDQQLTAKNNQKNRDIQNKAICFDNYLSDLQILKDFKMLSHIGKGCFSTVSLAVHKQTNKAYAIKAYEKIQSLQWYRLQSIKRQIKHLKRLHHENVIQLFHVFKDKKRLLLLMDNGGKQSLSGLLRKSRNFTQQKAKFYFKQILKAVSYCHAHGISHRDIKPQNILVDDEGNVKIIDFGFSAPAFNKLTTYCGTPPFMSPEITKKLPYCGAGADVWALGVMLYLLVVGNLPFRAANQQQLYRLIQQGKYPIKDTMSKNLKSILNKMLTCDSTKRPSAQTLLSDIWLQ